MTDRDVETVVQYHERTKHHFHRYARSAEYMDWHNQPSPFRFWESVPAFSLPLMEREPELLFGDLFTPASGPGRAVTLQSLGRFFELSLAISAWKAAGQSRWALRINPSSGNLHPTEGHLILPAVPGLESGVYHYNPFRHELEQRAVFPSDPGPDFRSHFGCDGFLVALTSIFWRESWKYGERAYRYCNLDVGHAVAALACAARLNDWRLHVLGGAGDAQMEALLGFDRVDWPFLEEERAELICWIGTADIPDATPPEIPGFLPAAAEALSFGGKPNALSRKPVDWSVIYRAHRAAEKPATETASRQPCPLPALSKPEPAVAAASVIRRRRSAVQYDPRRTIAADVFFAIMDRTRPRRGVIPFDIGMEAPFVDLLVFVHRVEGVASGLYLLPRSDDRKEQLRAAFEKQNFMWRTAHADMPFYLLRPEDVVADAMETSCHQDIAGQGAFAVSMLASFREPIEKAPYLYRRLHWECGMIGQVLYLEAEAYGLRGTGIGCFFDDAVHGLLGLSDNRFQCLYHFTAGHPVEDDRLTTLPAYHHLIPAGS